MASLFKKAGLTPEQFDVSAVESTMVLGFFVGQRMAANQAIATLLQVYAVDLVEFDGQIVAVPRGHESQVTIDERDLGARIWQGQSGDNREPEGFVETKMLMEWELPFRVDLTYFSYDHDYEQALQEATRYTKRNLQDALTVDTSLTLEADEARQHAEFILYDQWLSRYQFNWTLPPRWLPYVPTDIVTLPVHHNLYRVRVVGADIGLFGPIAFSAVLDDPAILEQVIAGGFTPIPRHNIIVAETDIVAWSGNALQDEDASSIGFYIAAAGKAPGDWPGATVYWSRDGGDTYLFLDRVADPAPIGKVRGVLAPGTTTGYWDFESRIEVDLVTGVLESTSEAAVLNGANMALIRDEVIQYVYADQTGQRTYKLSKLLRGRRGTDGHWGAHQSEDRFIGLAPGFIHRETLPDDLKGQTILLKAVGTGQSVAEVDPITLAISGDERKPYSSVNILGTRDGSNNLMVSWLWRARSNFEMREGSDIPPSEDPEAYSIDFVHGGSVVRTIDNVTSATVIYTAAQQTSDGITPGQPVVVDVFKAGQYGRGYLGEWTV